jgi:hypothetical protein
MYYSVDVLVFLKRDPMQVKQHRVERGIGAVRWALAAAFCAATTATRADVPKIAANPAPVAKPDKIAVKGSNLAIQTAILALEKEVVAHLSDPKTPLRAKCNYFVQNPPRDPLVPELIIEALDATYSLDSASDSYIKWQLLSGAPAKFDGDLAHQASIAYLDAARPVPRPGIKSADKKALDLLAKDVKTADDATALGQKLTDLIAPWQKRNAPVLAYRDELYSRLPQNGEALVARLEDLAQRVEAGYETDVEMKAATDVIDQWIDTKPPAQHLQVMADQLTAWMNRGKPPPTNTVIHGKGHGGRYTNVKHGKKDNGESPAFPPSYYDHVEFVPDPKGIGVVVGSGRVSNPEFKWQWAATSARQISLETLSDLVVTLEEFARIAKAADMTKN